VLLNKKGDEKIKLQKYLQQLGYSRRKADELVFKGKVKVNGVLADKPWIVVNENDRIEIEGEIIKVKPQNKYVYYVLNKPKGYVSSLYDPKETMTLKLLIKDIKEPVKPAGRLDKDTTGVLILTNDGDLINILTSARFGIKKVYVAKVSGVVEFEKLLKLKNGIKDNGDFLKLEYFEILEKGFDYSIVKVEMIKGKKHEIKRLFKHIGHEVMELKRIAHGPIDISLVPKPGQIKKIEGKHLERLLSLKNKLKHTN